MAVLLIEIPALTTVIVRRILRLACVKRGVVLLGALHVMNMMLLLGLAEAAVMLLAVAVMGLLNAAVTTFVLVMIIVLQVIKMLENGNVLVVVLAALSTTLLHVFQIVPLGVLMVPVVVCH